MKSAAQSWKSPLGIVAVAIALTVAAIVTGLGATVERLVEPARFAMLRHDASGQLLVVEMDAESAAAIKRWPWPREYYASAVDHLLQEGAKSIVFDVDFSSSSTPGGDAAFARSLARSSGLVALPTFAQRTRTGELRSIDTLPLPLFRRNAALASVSIAPDDDGTVRQAPFGTITAGTPRPSLSAFIAGRSGQADSFFPIDYSIRPESIPRLSFVTVSDGHFDPALVRGRAVLIGATAIEMGDRYATPGWGVIPGVIVQALAAETLIEGTPVSGSWEVSIAVAAMLGLVLARARSAIGLAVATTAFLLLFCAIVVGFQAFTQCSYPIAPGILLILFTAATRAPRMIIERFRTQRLVDEQTGLPNRPAMLEAYQADQRHYVAIAGIHNLGSVAAVMGPSVTAEFVLRIADRLRLAANDGSVFRIGDNLLAFTLGTHDDVEDVLLGLRAVLLHPLEAGNRKIDASITVGVALVGAAGIEVALTNALLAAEKAYAQGRFWMEDDTDLEDLAQSISLMGELDAALSGGEVYVHYQPKMSLSDDSIISVEALVRWTHPQRGNIRPDIFIPLAEQTGRITPLTLYVLEQTMQDLAIWRAAGHDLTAAVNISARLVAIPSFNQSVHAMLDRNIVPATALVFEVTESAPLANPEAAIKALQYFRARGVGISMDDYGTGQSTLSYLRTLPLTELKIDRSFVENAHRSRADAAMVRSTVELAHELGIKVVAEGIEDVGCLEFLRSVRCDVAQGYLISRPIPARDIASLLSAPIHIPAAA
ncbi:EAL domain-containing protein [Sphingobium sufflavum]|uniref:putative bifunctional diguanylate cyclase/phosphodiesterase n=1 Tax=Sphingobium sufflavum TaxID=1129547 RepID=UPI001F1EB3E7|nr:EAL domain-containing protein [Sphingobium sufflavum]MCE7798847.1 EAL domain-containing protein [Sphingobium sufflavum]